MLMAERCADPIADGGFLFFPAILDHHQGDIVGLWSAFGKRGDGALDRLVQRVAGAGLVFHNRLAQLLPSEKLASQVLSQKKR